MKDDEVIVRYEDNHLFPRKYYLKMTKAEFDEYYKLNNLARRNSFERVKFDEDLSRLKEFLKVKEKYCYCVEQEKLSFDNSEDDKFKDGEIEMFCCKKIYVHIKGTWDGKETADDYKKRLIKKAKDYFDEWIAKVK